MGEFTDEALRAVVDRYELARVAARDERDAAMRAFHDNGWRVGDLQRVTGYSRETIRQALDPEARRSINESRREAAARRRAVRERFVVPRTLDELQGPAQGRIVLPGRLNVFDDASYDLDQPKSVSRLYESVLFQATSIDDLRSWINPERLREHWRRIMLPPGLRELWERRFPQLGRRWS
jgi:hypothetical protein